MTEQPDPALAVNDPDLLAEDPDLAAQAGERGGRTDDARELVTETLLPEGEDADETDEAYGPRDVPSRPFTEGFTAFDEQQGETLEQRLEQEVPDTTDPAVAAQHSGDEADDREL